MNDLPILDKIGYVGQPYYDRPVFELVRPKPLAAGVALAYGLQLHPLNVIAAYEYTTLDWKRRGKGGKLLPRVPRAEDRP